MHKALSVGRAASGFERSRARTGVTFLLPVLALVALGVAEYGRAVGQMIDLAGLARSAGQSLAEQGILGDAAPDQLAAILRATGVLAPGATRAAPAADSLEVKGYCRCAEVEVRCGTTCSGAVLPQRYMVVTVARRFETLFDYPFLQGSRLLRQSALLPVPR